MRLLAIGVCLVAVFHLATAHPAQDQSTDAINPGEREKLEAIKAADLKGKLKSNFFYISPGGQKGPRAKPAAGDGYQRREEGPTHSRARRSAAQQVLFVSQPRVPRFTYIRVYQHLPEPEPEPEPAPLPPPVVEEQKHLLEEEHHDQEDEEHDEEDEHHETELQVLEGAAGLPVAQEVTPGVVQEVAPGVAQEVAQVVAQEVAQQPVLVPATNTGDLYGYRDIVSTEEINHKEREKYDKKKLIISSRVSHPKLAYHTNHHHPVQHHPVQHHQVQHHPVHHHPVHHHPVHHHSVRPTQAVSPVAIPPPTWAPLPHMIVANPPALPILYDKLGLLHAKLETAPGERLDLVPLAGLGQWGVEVDDPQGHGLGYLPLGHGGVDLLPILGRGGHVDWVLESRDAKGIVHDVHLKSAHEHLRMSSILRQGQPVTGLLGFDHTGDIVVPIKVQPLPQFKPLHHFKKLHHFKHHHHCHPLPHFQQLEHFQEPQPYFVKDILHPTAVFLH